MLFSPLYLLAKLYCLRLLEACESDKTQNLSTISCYSFSIREEYSIYKFFNFSKWPNISLGKSSSITYPTLFPSHCSVGSREQDSISIIQHSESRQHPRDVHHHQQRDSPNAILHDQQIQPFTKHRFGTPFHHQFSNGRFSNVNVIFFFIFETLNLNTWSTTYLIGSFCACPYATA